MLIFARAEVPTFVLALCAVLWLGRASLSLLGKQTNQFWIAFLGVLFAFPMVMDIVAVAVASSAKSEEDREKVAASFFIPGPAFALPAYIFASFAYGTQVLLLKLRDKDRAVVAAGLVAAAMLGLCIVQSQVCRLLGYFTLGLVLFWSHTSLSLFFQERSGHGDHDGDAFSWLWVWSPVTACLTYPLFATYVVRATTEDSSLHKLLASWLVLVLWVTVVSSALFVAGKRVFSSVKELLDEYLLSDRTKGKSRK